MFFIALLLDHSLHGSAEL